MNTKSSRDMCPFAKADMTPCYIRDGEIVIVKNSRGTQTCVGCGKLITVVKQEAANRAADVEG